ncbi:hypothetical protein [Microseira sp. BLCC-F43]|uniref:hypothetical protein n=1 Tax=Microseira sp. BLCC-F43 TaxID=3153602 RepID=UPI0035B899CE
MNKAPQELLAQVYPTTVNEILVMSQIVGILISMTTDHLKEKLQITEISQDDIDFITTDIAEKAQQIVNEYSLEEITEYLDVICAKQAPVQTGNLVFLATSPKTRGDV